MFKKQALNILFLILVFITNNVFAQTAEEVVRSKTNEIVTTLSQNKNTYKNNQKYFYEDLDRILEPVINVDGIVRTVMGPTAKTATNEQFLRFKENFKENLFKFYGSALLEYEGQDIKVLSSQKIDAKRQQINLEFTGQDGAKYPFQYTMEVVDNVWKLRNIVINGINVGKMFKDQFTDSMRRNKNNLDKVIDTWGDAIAKTKAS